VLVDGEEQDEQCPEEERRHGVEDEGEAGEDVVDGLVPPDHLEDPEGDRDDEGEQRREAHEHERLRELVGDQRPHALVVGVRVPQIVVAEEPQEVLVELVPDRQGEPVQDVELVDLGRRRLCAQYGAGLSPGDDLGQEEDDQQDTEGHDDGLDEPTDQVADHRFTSRTPPEEQDRPDLAGGLMSGRSCVSDSSRWGDYFVRYQFSGVR
jgi:hypothetical protein